MQNLDALSVNHAFPRQGEAVMGHDKVQGEGDYESARRFDKDQQRFVKEHTRGGQEIRGSAEEASDELTAAEREARSHAKDGGQDQRDARKMDALEKKQRH
jgi:hypothetical protein